MSALATLTRASYAFRGWGWSDWWNKRYVQLNCDESLSKSCALGNVLAVTSNYNKDFKYPLITFCSIYFDKLPSFDEAIKDLDNSNDKDRQNNALNLRNQVESIL